MRTPMEVDEVRLGGAGDLLTLIRRHGPLTRAEIVDRTGLARTTVNQRLDTLVAATLVRSAGESASTGGRRAGRFAFATDAGVLLVADLGASGMRVAVCDLAGTIQSEREVRQDIAEGPVAVLGLVTTVFAEMLEAVCRSADDVRGIGVSVPGPVEFATGRVVSPPIMTGWDDYDIPRYFADMYACRVVVENDVNAMAYGEQRVNHPDASHLLMLKVGTGVGSSVVAEGSVLRGAQGAAGDIGHTRVEVADQDDLPACHCGNVGCVEAYAGGWALARDLTRAGYEASGVDQVAA